MEFKLVVVLASLEIDSKNLNIYINKILKIGKRMVLSQKCTPLSQEIKNIKFMFNIDLKKLKINYMNIYIKEKDISICVDQLEKFHKNAEKLQ